MLSQYNLWHLTNAKLNIVESRANYVLCNLLKESKQCYLILKYHAYLSY